MKSKRSCPVWALNLKRQMAKWFAWVPKIGRLLLKIMKWLHKQLNIVLREMKSNLKSLIIWTLALVFITAVASWEFEAFVGNDYLMDTLETFEALFQAMGIQITDLSTPEGFLSLESIYFYIPLAIYAGLLGSSIISKEERDKTAEYLFTLPVTRKKVIISKIVVAFLFNLLLNLAVILGALIVYTRFSPSEGFYSFLWHLSLGIFLIQLIFMSVGMLFAAIMKQYKKSGAAVLAYVMGSYLLFVLIGLTDKIDFIKYVTPFKYFEASEMLTGNIELKFVLITLGIVISSIIGLFVFYRRRDLYI
ncbi:MAG: ABC transporter permease subunit [Acholeplasmataceae bacterium]|nr:ABC transporter permease subunit [Acholeplasmataceae bacterium]